MQPDRWCYHYSHGLESLLKVVVFVRAAAPGVISLHKNIRLL